MRQARRRTWTDALAACGRALLAAMEQPLRRADAGDLDVLAVLGALLLLGCLTTGAGLWLYVLLTGLGRVLGVR